MDRKSRSVYADTVLEQQGKYADAERLYREVVKLGPVAFGKDQPHIVTGLNRLATLLYHTGRLGGCEPLVRKALSIKRQHRGDDHPSVLMYRINLASLAGNFGAGTSRLQ